MPTAKNQRNGMPTHLWQHSLQYSLMHTLSENCKILLLRPLRPEPLRQEKNGTNIPTPTQTWTLIPLVPGWIGYGDPLSPSAALESTAALQDGASLFSPGRWRPEKRGNPVSSDCLSIADALWAVCCPPKSRQPQDRWTLSPRRQ